MHSFRVCRNNILMIFMMMFDLCETSVGQFNQFSRESLHLKHERSLKRVSFNMSDNRLKDKHTTLLVID